MTRRTAANRYAKALLEVALKEGDPAQVEHDLDGFADLLARHPQLSRVLLNPAIPSARKRDLVRELVNRLEGLSPIVAKLLLLLAERDRIPLFPDLIDAYRVRLMDHLQVVRTVVTSAAPLPEEKREALARALGAATGRRVQLTTQVDSSLIGGLIARVGSVVYDGSVTTQLARMKEKLIENV